MANKSIKQSCHAISLLVMFVTPVCSEELGFESWKIKDAAFTASSYKSSRSYPWMARLNALGAWCAHVNDTDPFLQVSQLTLFTVVEHTTGVT